MAASWQVFTVELKGEPEPFTVPTCALDWRNVTMDPNRPRALDVTFQLCHQAMKRLNMPVPRDYDGFCELLEGIPETIEEGDPEQLDPTQPDR